MNEPTVERYGIGQAVRRKEDARFLTGAGRYVDDVSMPGMAHLVILRSPHAHARIVSVDTTAAGAHPGVLAVLTGADWVAEIDGRLVELVDTDLDPVRIVAAAPAEILIDGKLPDRPLVVASEYERPTRKWISDQGLDAEFVRSYGATEVFPPEDADLIVDNTSTGSTLRANKLAVVDELLRSTTGLYANPAALEDRRKRERIDELVLVLGAVLEARRRGLTIERLDLRNSGDTAGDRNRVVGYGAWAVRDVRGRAAGMNAGKA